MRSTSRTFLAKARDLIRGNAERQAGLSSRQQKFVRIFVDEFQDTDPIQAEILQTRMADHVPGKLFIVGDPKQAIYRFRGTDASKPTGACATSLERNAAVESCN